MKYINETEILFATLYIGLNKSDTKLHRDVTKPHFTNVSLFHQICLSRFLVKFRFYRKQLCLSFIFAARVC